MLLHSQGEDLDIARRPKDRKGEVCGKLTAERIDQKTSYGEYRWLYRCECGGTTVQHPQAAGVTGHCGCLTHERHSKRSTKHGQVGELAYNSWCNMKSRCSNPKNPHYEKYGGRGISVCDDWQNSFVNFFRDMGERPSGTTLERIRNNGNYEPGNCCWATKKEQQNNRRNNVILTIKGVSRTIAEWAFIVDVKQSTISSRLRLGWSHEDAVFKPVAKRKRKNV